MVYMDAIFLPFFLTSQNLVKECGRYTKWRTPKTYKKVLVSAIDNWQLLSILCILALNPLPACRESFAKAMSQSV